MKQEFVIEELAEILGKSVPTIKNWVATSKLVPSAMRPGRGRHDQNVFDRYSIYKCLLSDTLMKYGFSRMNSWLIVSQLLSRDKIYFSTTLQDKAAMLLSDARKGPLWLTITRENTELSWELNGPTAFDPENNNVAVILFVNLGKIFDYSDERIREWSDGQNISKS